MPKHSPIARYNVPKPVRECVQVTLLIDSNVVVTGSVSGERYVFKGAGSVVDVDIRDVESLLEKRQGEKQCCGGTGNGNKVFELLTKE